MLPDYEQIAKALECNVQTCDSCACRYVEWWADEPLWEQIVGSYEGLLCIDCFRLRCQENGIVTVLVDSMAR